MPSGRTPAATIALLAINTSLFAAQHFSGADDMLPAAWRYGDVAPLAVALWYLWLFGDNVEARVGRVTFGFIFLLSAALAVWVPAAVGMTSTAPGLALAGGVSGIVGAYFLLLPRARVLLLVPTPAALVEVPAMFFFGLWWMFQFLTFVVAPAAARREFHAGPVMWGLAAALGVGAAIARLTRRPVRWT